MLKTLRQPLSDLPSQIALHPRGSDAPDAVTVRPPGSKSLSNRALLLGALASGQSTIRHALTEADDGRVMIRALGQLGAHIGHQPDGSLAVVGVSGQWATDGPTTLDLHNAGTATRFLAAAALLAKHPITLDGNARMRERPIAELAEVLQRFGANVSYAKNNGCPPVTIAAQGKCVEATAQPVIEIGTTQSSQFISAIALVAPFLPKGLTLRLTGEVTSPSYVVMTLGLLAKLGVRVQTSEDIRLIRIAPCELAGFDYSVEPDASGATYFWAAGAMVPGLRCKVEGLDATSLQGDARFPEVLGRMGARIGRSTVGADDPYVEVEGPSALKPILVELSEMPDAAMTLASVACFAEGTSILRGLRTLRVKETDRIEAMRNELTKVGVTIENPVQGDDGTMTITPPPGGIDCSPNAPPVVFDTYDDHRMAMSLALIGLRRPNVRINDPKCVAKTYPTFWGDFARLYAPADSTD